MKDQADVVAENEELKAKLKKAEDDLKASTDKCGALACDLEALKARTEKAEAAHAETVKLLDDAKGKLEATTKERDELKTKDFDADKRAAAIVRAAGIVSGGNAAEVGRKTKPATLTEQCEAARKTTKVTA
jgi:chromosome segregation ATPase